MNRRQFLGSLIGARLSTINQPDSQSSLYLDLDRRIRLLETTERVGLNRIKVAEATDVFHYETTTGSWTTGVATNTWSANDGTSGIGYPKVTVPACRQCVVTVSGVWVNLGNDPNFQTVFGEIGVGVNAATPFGSLYSAGYCNADHDSGVSAAFTGFYESDGNSTTFQIMLRLSNNVPGAPELPGLYYSTLTVIPLN